MKQMIVSALVSLFTGFFLVVGLGGGVLVVKVIDDKLTDEPRKRRSAIRFTPLADAAIVESSVIRDVPNFTVRGSIRNTDSIDWDVAPIRLEILAEATVVGKCDERGSPEYRIVKPGQSISFLVVCENIKNPATGTTFEYRVKAERWDDQKK